MSAPATAAIRALPDVETPATPTAKRSKTRLRELGAEVDKLQDRLADLDDERKALKAQIAASIKRWNDEAAKRK